MLLIVVDQLDLLGPGSIRLCVFSAHVICKHHKCDVLLYRPHFPSHSPKMLQVEQIRVLRTFYIGMLYILFTGCNRYVPRDMVESIDG